jgi:HK97 family phage portal protein
VKFSLFSLETSPKSKPIEASKQLNAVDGGGWRSVIREAFTGAWQRNIVETQESIFCYPTVFSCVARIAKDIGKLTYMLKQRDDNGIWQATENAAYSPVLRKPNHFQTQQQFRESWIISKLLQGNAYILKQRDNRGVVVRLYVLDPCRVKPLVSESGDIFYELWSDRTNLLGDGRDETLIVPAREIIHDRELTLHHPLVGVPPMCAAYWPAVKNLQILRSAADFFGNGAQPGGILTAPGAINDETALRLQTYWDENFTGVNSGRVAVVGDGLKFEALSGKSVDSQMVEQLRYSDEQICQPFGVPPFKIGIGSLPAGLKIDDINNLYYSDALQDRVEHMENLLDEGLGVARPLGIECDLWPLLRMDTQKQADVETKLVAGAIKAPNEARLMFDLLPKTGGDAIYLQQQNYSLEALAKRDAQEDPFGTAQASAPALPAPSGDDEEIDEEEERAFMVDSFQKGFTAELST